MKRREQVLDTLPVARLGLRPKVSAKYCVIKWAKKKKKIKRLIFALLKPVTLTGTPAKDFSAGL